MAHASAPHNPFDDLTTELSDLSLRQEEQNSFSRVVNEPEDNDGPRPPDPVREAGDPLEIVAKCPRSMAVSYSLNWYYLPDGSEDTADYLICTRCHADHIKGTALESHFKQVEWSGGELAACGFWFPRVKDVLWPEAIRTNNTDALREYMTRSLQMKPCPGQTPTEDTKDRVLYGMMGNEIEGFVACEACYEDRIVGTSFESNFGTYSEEIPKWSCDLSISYISGAVAPMSKHNNWNGFISGASRRLQLPACTGEQIRSDAIEWYIPRNNAIEGYQVCETCFLDKLASTPFKKEFQRHSDNSNPELWLCGLADKNISTTMALEAALERRDFGVFAEAAQAICSLVPCTPNGIVHGNWLTIEGCDKFNICQGCFIGFIQTRGLDHFFRLSDRDASVAYLCDFCATSPRFLQYIGKFTEMLDRGVFSYFSDFVTTFAGVPACPKIQNPGNTRWWGYLEAQFCQECYLDFVALTPFANLLTMNGEFIEKKIICQMWSPRMRGLWLEVCKAGEPGSEDSDAALAEFKSFCAQRVQIYRQTISEIEFIKGMQKIKRQSALNDSLLSLQYQGMEGLATVMGTTDGYKYGSSSLGWYATSNGVQSKQYWNSFTNKLADSNRPEDWVRMAQLQEIWKTVE
jgi:hypothetical protein